MLLQLLTLVLPISGLVLSLALAIMMRSTKDYPKNFAHLRSEMIYQWLGIIGVADDIMSRKRNQIGKSDGTWGKNKWFYLLFDRWPVTYGFKDDFPFNPRPSVLKITDHIVNGNRGAVAMMLMVDDLRGFGEEKSSDAREYFF